MRKEIIITALLTLPSQVVADISGNIAINSDYIWRGYSQNSNKPAVSAGVNAEYKGVTLGVWASEVDFNDEAKYEYDLMIDYSHDFNETFGISTGVIHYKWDKVYDDINEAYIGVSIKDIGVTYYKDLNDSNLDFINLVYSVPLFEYVDLSLEYGKATGFNSYQAINISKEFGRFTFGGQVGSEETFIGVGVNL